MPASTFRSSGDLLADRRYDYARAAFEEGDLVAAADLARQALERAPGFAAALALLGRASLRAGEREEGLAALRRALALEPDDALGVRIDLAQAGALDTEAAITASYVRALFDDYAPRFERHLVRNLHYRGPELLADALRRTALRRFRSPLYGLALDLGCGTGLMGRVLEGAVERLEGVDLSPRMLAQATKTRAYDALREGDLVGFLEEHPDAVADLVVAADVFVYVADLAPVFAEARRVLRRGGFFAFTVQAHEGEGVVLGADARYAHGEGYLRGLAEACGLVPVCFEHVSTREDRGEPVPGFLVVAER